MKKFNEPQIYVVNNHEIAQKLDSEYFVTEGDFGKYKVVDYKGYIEERFVNFDNTIADNLHEYDVVIIDLQKTIPTILCQQNEPPKSEGYMFKIKYPKKKFNPVPIVTDIIQTNVKNNCFKIIFASTPYKEEYSVVKFNSQDNYTLYDSFSQDLYDYMRVSAEIKKGRLITSVDISLSTIIEKYVKEYNAIFNLPGKLNGEHYTVDPNYIPLLYNRDREVISYLGYQKDSGYELVLPVCDKKEELIHELISNYLPSLFPNIFPESNKFSWLKSNDFKPVALLECEAEKEKLKQKYENEILSIEEKEKSLIEANQFLFDLLTETGDRLVSAVCQFFKWLGYENVHEMDGEEEINREDLQIVEDNVLFIIEVKGIGGTSTDAECSQIAKHRRRREKENRDKDIIPIYIVNHQRYMNPFSRQNPPFSKNQIDYAEQDERGLLTTWQLYQQYKNIEKSIFTKDEVKDTLKVLGLIPFVSSSFIRIGKVNEYFKKHNASIINLENQEIKCGDAIWAKKESELKKGIIKSIQIDGQNVEEARNGEIGIVLDVELSKGFELFVKR